MSELQDDAMSSHSHADILERELRKTILRYTPIQRLPEQRSLEITIDALRSIVDLLEIRWNELRDEQEQELE